MMITRQCDYAVRIVRALSDGRKKSVGEICEEERVPQPYAYKILKKLEKAGIAKSFRGAKGGYALVQNTDQMTLADIYAVMEEMEPITACLNGDFDCPRNTDSKPCKVHLEFDRVQTALIKEFQRTPLSELF